MARPEPLAALIPEDWKRALAAELEKPYWRELEAFVARERREQSVLPPPEKVFNALKHTPLDQVKVVLLGQDPYPTKGNACGLSFCVEPGMPIPGSLRNMFKVLYADVGAKIPTHGNLLAWAHQGVLLLNTVLTVREGEPHSHRGKGWEQFTRTILEQVNARPERVVFLLLGKHAQAMADLVDTSKHAIVTAPHPSPASPGNPFGKTRPFSAVNAALREAGRGEVRWELD